MLPTSKWELKYFLPRLAYLRTGTNHCNHLLVKGSQSCPIRAPTFVGIFLQEDESVFLAVRYERRPLSVVAAVRSLLIPCTS